MAIHNPIMSMQTTPPFSDPANTWNRRFAEPGLLFGSEPNGWLREHAHVWSPGERVLCVAFAGLDIDTLREYEADLSEGSGPHGRSALIGMVARRRPEREAT